AAADRQLRLQLQQLRADHPAHARRAGHPRHHHAGRHHRSAGQLHLPHCLPGFGAELRPGRRHRHADLHRRRRHGLAEPEAFQGQGLRITKMAMVQPKSVKYRVWLTHAALLGFIALIVFPLLMVVSISFREGNFATGSLLPDNPTLEHWSLALGIPYVHESGQVSNPPFPVLTWLWNSIKIALISSALILMLSTTSAYAFARLRFAGKGPILKGMLIFQMFPPVLTL